MTTVSTLADIHAIESSPVHDPYQGCSSTFDMLTKGATIAPRSLAMSFFLQTEDYKRPFTWTYQENMQHITQIANFLHRLGVKRDDVVAYMLPNLPETAWIIWAGEAAGTVMAINPMLEANVIAQLLQAANVKWLITLEATPGVNIWEKAQQIAPQVPTLQGILTVSPLAYLRGIKGWAARLAMARKMPSHIGALPVINLQKAAMLENGDQLNFAPPHLDDTASYFCTGGTTGLPKIAKRNHRVEVSNVVSIRGVLGSVAQLGNSLFCGLPLFHVNAQLGSLLAAWSCGAHFVIGTPQGYRGPGLIANFWRIAEHYKLYTFSGVPTVYTALMQVPIGKSNISSLKLAICGAAPMPVELFRSFEKLTGIRILEGYGLTEAGCVSSINPPDGLSKIGSIGLRLPGQEMRIVILDDEGRYLRDAQTDEPGIIAIHGPNQFQGYLLDAHNRGLWIDIPDASDTDQQWLNTGDLGRCDTDGYFWLTGRKKELIIRGGHNIDPKSIEEVMHSHPAVAMAAAVGRPDSHAGELPVVYVQLKPGIQASTEDLMAHAAQHIQERAALPKAIQIMDVLPTTAVGKIFKPALVLQEIEAIVRAEAKETKTALVRVTAEQTNLRGTLAHITVQGDSAALAQRLGAYTFNTDIVSL